jgi:type IV secretory pathway VirB6-like protein
MTPLRKIGLCILVCLSLYFILRFPYIIYMINNPAINFIVIFILIYLAPIIISKLVFKK